MLFLFLLNGDQLDKFMLFTKKYFLFISFYIIIVSFIHFQTESDLDMANFTKVWAAIANQFDWKRSDLNATEKRQFEKITQLGFSAVNDTAKIELVCG